MSGGSIVVLGSLHLDVMVQAPGRPRLGETMVGSGWSLKEGGKGGNQAVAAARHGGSVAMVGLVGDDDFGRRLRRNLAAQGVDVGCVGVDPAASSGMSVAITEPSGDYGAIIVSGVNLALDAAAVERSRTALAAARWLVLQNEVPEAANVAAARITRAGGGTVILNAAPARPLSPELAGLVDILVVNALEAEALAAVVVTDIETAARAASGLVDLVPCVVVTAGGDGLAVASRDGWTLRLAAHPVPVMSTHGAGDAFIGAFTARLAMGQTRDDALRYANAAAALLVSTPDGARGAVGPDAVLRLL